MTVSYQRAKQAKSQASELFAQFGPVNGVGVTRAGDGFAVKVNFESAPDSQADLPSEIEGVPVRVEVVGKIRAGLAR